MNPNTWSNAGICRELARFRHVDASGILEQRRVMHDPKSMEELELALRLCPTSVELEYRKLRNQAKRIRRSRRG